MVEDYIYRNDRLLPSSQPQFDDLPHGRYYNAAAMHALAQLAAHDALVSRQGENR
jgi:hypothetical protein